MATALLVTILLAVVVGVAVLARWPSRSWTIVHDEEAHAARDGGVFWLGLRAMFGRGPPRLTYRRDDRGRFRKHRR